MCQFLTSCGTCHRMGDRGALTLLASSLKKKYYTEESQKSPECIFK